MTKLLWLIPVLFGGTITNSSTEIFSFHIEQTKFRNFIEFQGKIIIEDTTSFDLFCLDFELLCPDRYDNNLLDRIQQNDYIDAMLLIQDENLNYYSPYDFMKDAQARKIKKTCYNNRDIDGGTIACLVLTPNYSLPIDKVTLSTKKLKKKNLQKIRFCYNDVNAQLKSNWLILDLD